MGLINFEFRMVDSRLFDNLTSGICDNCKIPEMVNMGGDGINEPSYKEFYCNKKKIIIEPQPPETQVKECDCFESK